MFTLAKIHLTLDSTSLEGSRVLARPRPSCLPSSKSSSTPDFNVKACVASISRAASISILGWPAHRNSTGKRDQEERRRNALARDRYTGTGRSAAPELPNFLLVADIWHQLAIRSQEGSEGNRMRPFFAPPPLVLFPATRSISVFFPTSSITRLHLTGKKANSFVYNCRFSSLALRPCLRCHVLLPWRPCAAGS